MRKVIRLGDPTSHGGKVVSAEAEHFKVAGLPVACIGDTCSCPLPGHNGCKIATGSEHHRINGKAVAFEGDLTTCGAKLISTASNFQTNL